LAAELSTVLVDDLPNSRISSDSSRVLLPFGFVRQTGETVCVHQSRLSNHLPFLISFASQRLRFYAESVKGLAFDIPGTVNEPQADDHPKP
jgi:hypothetical protein